MGRIEAAGGRNQHEANQQTGVDGVECWLNRRKKKEPRLYVDAITPATGG